VTDLRPMRWWHIEAVAAIEAALFDDAWSVEMFWDELAQGATRTYLVAVEGEEIVGYAGLAAMPDEAYVQNIAVVPDHRRRGLGARLLTALLDDARRRGFTKVGLEVRVDNDAAIALYERFGFRRVGLRRRYYQPSGTDALVMAWDATTAPAP
jgi:ribosomal-protein-alanine N-acetyltransferase